LRKALDFLVYRGLRRGLLGGQRTWLVLGGAALVTRLVVRVFAKEHEVVFSEKLAAGERVVITHRQRSGDDGRR